MFEHLRLSEDRDDTMEVINPMYMKSLHESDDIEEPDDDEFSIYSATNVGLDATLLYGNRCICLHYCMVTDAYACTIVW